MDLITERRVKLIRRDESEHRVECAGPPVTSHYKVQPILHRIEMLPIKQPVILDLEMSTDVARAAASDRIEDAVDYKAVSKRLKQFVGESRFELVETLAERCAEIIRNEHGVRWVRLTVNKIGAVTDANDVGVIIERGERF